MERPLWAEQRPEDWWDAARQAVRGVLRKAGIRGSDVRGVGLSGQMHGLTLLDADGRGAPTSADLGAISAASSRLTGSTKSPARTWCWSRPPTPC